MKKPQNAPKRQPKKYQVSFEEAKKIVDVLSKQGKLIERIQLDQTAMQRDIDAIAHHIFPNSNNLE